jgi:hypothetical protein
MILILILQISVLYPIYVPKAAQKFGTCNTVLYFWAIWEFL